MAKKSSDGGSKGGSESDGNQSDASSDMGDTLEDLRRPRLNGYYGLTTLLLDEIYLPFF